MPRYHFETAHHLPTVHQELIAGGITPQAVEGRDGEHLWITVPEVKEVAVTEIIEAHDGPAAMEAVAWEAVRVDRNGRLSGSDWTALADSPLSGVEEAAWFAYRQSLRDVPQDHDDPTDITWPEPPS
jgi:hypothetical protein